VEFGLVSVSFCVKLELCREHDKNPEAFFQILYGLHGDGFNFRLSVLGQMFTDVPGVFLPGLLL